MKRKTKKVAEVEMCGRAAMYYFQINRKLFCENVKKRPIMGYITVIVSNQSKCSTNKRESESKSQSTRETERAERLETKQ